MVDGGQRGFIANREYPDSINEDFPGVIIRTVNAKDLHFDVEIGDFDFSVPKLFSETRRESCHGLQRHIPQDLRHVIGSDVSAM